MSSFTNGIDHAERCQGLPLFAQDDAGHWSARCNRWLVSEGGTHWEVSGCESRAEAGVFFYGARMYLGRIIFEGRVA